MGYLSTGATIRGRKKEKRKRHWTGQIDTRSRNARTNKNCYWRWATQGWPGTGRYGPNLPGSGNGPSHQREGFDNSLSLQHNQGSFTPTSDVSASEQCISVGVSLAVLSGITPSVRGWKLKGGEAVEKGDEKKKKKKKEHTLNSQYRPGQHGTPTSLRLRVLWWLLRAGCKSKLEWPMMPRLSGVAITISSHSQMSLYQDQSGSGLELQGNSSAADTYHIVEVIFPTRRERNNYTEYSDATKTGERGKQTS